MKQYYCHDFTVDFRRFNFLMARGNRELVKRVNSVELVCCKEKKKKNTYDQNWINNDQMWILNYKLYVERIRELDKSWIAWKNFGHAIQNRHGSITINWLFLVDRHGVKVKIFTVKKKIYIGNIKCMLMMDNETDFGFGRREEKENKLYTAERNRCQNGNSSAYFLFVTDAN